MPLRLCLEAQASHLRQLLGRMPRDRRTLIACRMCERAQRQSLPTCQSQAGKESNTWPSGSKHSSWWRPPVSAETLSWPGPHRKVVDTMAVHTVVRIKVIQSHGHIPLKALTVVMFLEGCGGRCR